MIKDKLSYLKSISEALKTYNEQNTIIDYELVKKIYEYTNKLDELTLGEKKELDDFITENTISIEHLANIYLDKKGEESLNYRLTRMLPIQLTNHQSKIRFIKGKEEELKSAMQQTSMVKVLCKKGNVSKAA